MADDLALIIDPDLAFIAEVDGKPQGMCILLPNLNELLHEYRHDNTVLPSALEDRVAAQGVEAPAEVGAAHAVGHSQRAARRARYMGLSAAMYVEVARRGVAKGYQWGELSWTREDDSPINSGIAHMGAKVYKRYRIYRKALG
jgi:hypothetical protein